MGIEKIAGNDLFPCHSDGSVIIQRLAEESGFLCVLSEAVGKGQDQTTGIDTDFQKVNQCYLWNAEK